jgi:hypothetical protein
MTRNPVFGGIESLCKPANAGFAMYREQNSQSQTRRIGQNLEYRRFIFHLYPRLTFLRICTYMHIIRHNNNPVNNFLRKSQIFFFGPEIAAQTAGKGALITLCPAAIVVEQMPPFSYNMA